MNPFLTLDNIARLKSIRTQIIDILVSDFCVPIEMIHPQAHLSRDLGFDIIRQALFIQRIISHFSIPIPAYKHSQLYTIQKVMQYLYKHQNTPTALSTSRGLLGSVVIFFTFFLQTAWSQNNGTILGIVKDKRTQEALVGVTVQAENTTLGTTTDTDGKFKLTLPVGSYNLKASFVGYKAASKFNVVLTSGNAQQINFELEEEALQLEEAKVVFNRSISVASVETPNSIQKLTTEEIKNNPGGNFDISRVIQVLPGVGGTAGSVGGFRNDLIIRGGGPNENVFYLDGIEIPVINHFATQGSSGGPTGILNVSFIEDATLSSSSFNARYDNALSSVLQFRQREGNPERVQGNIRVSSTEVAGTFEGPLSPKTTFLASVRRSYLQFLFKAIDLPIRPNYWDFQYKVTHKINKKTTLTAIGVGAIDEFTFAVPKESSPEKEYILRSNPNINQWNYTTGFSLKRLLDNGFLNVSLSRNMFDNRLDRFEDNRQGDERYRVLKSNSQEIENKLRIDVNKFVGKWEYSYGAVLQYVKYNNDFFNILRREIKDAQGQIIQPAVNISFNTAIDFFKYGAFAQVNRKLFNDRLNLSAGLRTDMNSFTDEGNNPLQTLSPRLSASYQLSDKWRINASIGRYFKTPIYTVLGYRQDGNFVNKSNKYIRSDHLVAGLEFIPTPTTRITLEGFSKTYDNYPVSTRDGISLANQGGNFGAIGNEAVTSTGQGRSRGVEFFVQQKLTKNFFGVLSYTYFKSEFTGKDGKYIASAWDNRHLLSTQLGYKFKKGWELGLKWLYQGGSPYTPFDLVASQRNYLTTGVGTEDYTRLNSQRLKAFSRVDFRVDKKWNYKKISIDLFFDFQNALLTANPAFPQYTFERLADNSGFKTTDGQALKLDGSNGIPLILANEDSNFTPALGLVIEF
ncbi:TonB-dependent receptor [Runella sp. MFBS21]|uniref:TonB-dependent receptor domain-containing protein n=1 Tax=Runella sp. MFBS21 TaxID=3034018 RepID=UPI0023F7CFE5|nr:TonB-dependent receptor [Runella sp. MFBS21]MDF7816709.1 TonB-dependent receptor [Runella sp. MFBS21]